MSIQKKINSSKIPQKLQGILWSVDIKHLDIEKDKGYIIHQIFSYGNFDDISWVLKTYSKKDIISTFTKIPFKDYRASRFNLIKNFLLGLRNFNLNERLYVKNIPRDIR